MAGELVPIEFILSQILKSHINSPGLTDIKCVQKTLSALFRGMFRHIT
jgi:hypothetical protein